VSDQSTRTLHYHKSAVGCGRVVDTITLRHSHRGLSVGVLSVGGVQQICTTSALPLEGAIEPGETGAVMVEPRVAVMKIGVREVFVHSLHFSPLHCIHRKRSFGVIIGVIVRQVML